MSLAVTNYFSFCEYSYTQGSSCLAVVSKFGLLCIGNVPYYFDSSNTPFMKTQCIS